MRRVRELACNDGWMAEIEFNGRVWGKFFYDTLIPQPREIIRKTVSGSYKCGFYFDEGFKSPLDVIWEDGSGSRFLAKVLHWPVTGLFAWWAAESAIDALSTWSSVILMQAKCKDPDATASMFLGSAFTGVDGPGSIAGYAEEWGNHHWSDPAVGQFTAPPDDMEVQAWGHFECGNRLVDTIAVGYTPVNPVTGIPSDAIFFDHPTPGARVSWGVPSRFVTAGGTAAVAIYVKFSAGSAGFGVTFGCDAFTAQFGERAHDPHPALPTPEQQPGCVEWGFPPKGF